MFGNKQQLVVCATGCPKPHLFSADSQFSGQPKNNVNTFSTLHHLSPVIFGTVTVVAFELPRNSRLNIHCYIQREPTPTPKSAWKWQLRPFMTSCSKDYKGHSLVQTSITELPNRHYLIKCTRQLTYIPQGLWKEVTWCFMPSQPVRLCQGEPQGLWLERKQ